SFSGHKEVLVRLSNSNYKSITAESIFINTGTQARVPEIEGLQSVKFLTSKTILDLKYLPEHLLIIGGGYIALEFSQIFRRMGSQVTIIEQSPRLLPREDDDVASMIRQVLEAEGVKIITRAIVRRVSTTTDESIYIEVLSEYK